MYIPEEGEHYTRHSRLRIGFFLFFSWIHLLLLRLLRLLTRLQVTDQTPPILLLRDIFLPWIRLKPPLRQCCCCCSPFLSMPMACDRRTKRRLRPRSLFVCCRTRESNTWWQFSSSSLLPSFLLFLQTCITIIRLKMSRSIFCFYSISCVCVIGLDERTGGNGWVRQGTGCC